MNRSEPIIRDFLPGDAGRLIEIASALNLSPWSREDLEEESRRSDSFMRVVEIEGRTAGFIVARSVPGASGHRPDAELYNIGIERSMQRSGLGARLIEELFVFCRVRNVHALWLEVRAGNRAAIEFYERFGFESVSTRKGFYDRPTEDAVVMRVHLDVSGE